MEETHFLHSRPSLFCCKPPPPTFTLRKRWQFQMPTEEQAAAAILRTKVWRLRAQREKATGDIETSGFRTNTLRIQRGRQRQKEQESVGRHSFCLWRCVKFTGHSIGMRVVTEFHDQGFFFVCVKVQTAGGPGSRVWDVLKSGDRDCPSSPRRRCCL